MSADRERDAPAMKFDPPFGPCRGGSDRPTADGEGAGNPVDPSAVALREVVAWEVLRPDGTRIDVKLHGYLSAQFRAMGYTAAPLYDEAALRAMEERARRAEADAKELAGRLRDAIDGEDYLAIAYNQEHARAQALAQENAKLREALRPFAEAAESIEDHDPAYRDGDHLWESPAAMALMAGDLRRAAALLQPEEAARD